MKRTPSCVRISGQRAFSLVEVVLALGICTFALVALVGLFGFGLQAGRESEDEIQAANLSSLIISTRAASPKTEITDFVIPSDGLTGAYGDIFLGQPTYVGFDGKLTNLANAAYQITCQAGTNAVTGPNLAQVYLKLTWPPNLNATDGRAKRYELLTYIPLQ